MLTATEDGVLILLAEGRSVALSGVEGAATCRPGDLVSLTGPDEPTGPETAAATTEGQAASAPSGLRAQVVWRHPTGEFPAPGSDALRLGSGLRWSHLRRRAEALDTTRAFFRHEGFLEVETPVLVVSAGTEVHLAAVPATLRPRDGAPPEPRYLSTSPEYHMKRLLAAGSPAIFQVARVFRDGERGARHRPEFTMLEWYRPFAGYEDLMRDCEAWLVALAGGTTLRYRGHEVDLTPPWPRLSFHEALRTLGGVDDPDALTPDEQLEILAVRVEPQLGVERPVFLVDYPIEMASLARPKPTDPRRAERFELYIAGLELANAFGELTDAAEQRRRCEADNTTRRSLGLPEYPMDEEFLQALEHGMPPSAGIAVGLDRVLMLLSDTASIDAVVAF